MSYLWNICGDDFEEFEQAASVLAVLAFPEGVENERRDEAYRWFCGRAVRVMTERDPSWVNRKQALRPAHTFAAARQLGSDYGALGGTVLRDRMVAAKMAMPFLIRQATGKSPKLPRDVKRLSIRAMANYCADDAQQANADNVKTRVWRPSRPVIHLACAIAVKMEDVERAGRLPLTFDDFLLDWSLTEEVVHTAEDYEKLVEREAGLRISGDELVRVRLACAVGSLHSA